MRLFEAIDRVIYIHSLIKKEATGPPDVFASKLCVKKRHLYNILEEFKDYGAEIKYKRKDKTYYYANKFDISVELQVKPA